MKIITRKKLALKQDSYCLISLFMKGFLRRENLEQNRRLGRWLGALDHVRLSNWGKWADFTRRAFLAETIPPLCAALERPLGESELLFLGVFVEDFVEKFVMERLTKF